MKIAFDEIEMAFDFVSSDVPFTNTAYLSKTTGKVYYHSVNMDFDEIPEDVETSDEYIEIPHKNDLGLGRKLVRKFAFRHMPDQLDHIEDLFSRKGAYSRFKDFLIRADKIELWYRFEEEKSAEALRDWCNMQEIDLE